MDTKDLINKTKQELKEIAQELGLDGEGLTKPQLIELIESHKPVETEQVDSVGVSQPTTVDVPQATEFVMSQELEQRATKGTTTSKTFEEELAARYRKAGKPVPYSANVDRTTSLLNEIKRRKVKC